MTKKLNTYSFLPWIREGIANEMLIDPVKDKLHAILDASFRIKGTGISSDPIYSERIEKPISLYGPGDIIGIDSRAIIKTEPRNWITNFEPNYLASIDFYDEDFPWRYSPDPGTAGLLQPWLALVVVEEGKFEDGKDMTNRPLPYIKLTEAPQDIFQSSDQLWAWAHVHVNRDLIENDVDPGVETVIERGPDFSSIIQEFKDTLAENPDLAYSRIMCPQKLKANTAYHAFVIPAFESGRLAGLGLDMEGQFNAVDSQLSHLTPAWPNSNEEPVISRMDAEYFPVYHRWYFRTGNVGDFEYLVKLLEPKPVDNRVGRRDMDVTQPGSNILGITDEPENGVKMPQLGGVLRLGGALRIPVDAITDADELEEYQRYENWDQPYPRKFQKQLAVFINLADDYSKNSVKEAHDNEDLPDEITVTAAEDDPDPLITAPLYGRWHALTKRLLQEGDGIPDTNWVHKLNLDPRFRVAAGFGTKIVQSNQENYMEAAWRQVGDVIEANRRIRYAQLAQFASKQWFSKYLKPMKQNNPGDFLWLTQPIQSRVVSRGLNLEGNEEILTVHHQVKASKIPTIVFSPNIRKCARPGNRLVKSLKFNEKSNPVSQLIDGINRGKLNAAPPKKIPKGLRTLKELSSACKPKLQKAPDFILKWIEKYKWFKYVVLGIAIVIFILLAVFAGPNLRSISFAVRVFTPTTATISGLGLLIAISLVYLYIKIKLWEKQLKYANTLKEENQTPTAVNRLPKMPNFRLLPFGEKADFSPGSYDSEEGKRFKKALKDVGEIMQANIKAAQAPKLPQLYLDRIASATLDALDPEVSISSYIYKTQVAIPARLQAERVQEKLKEIMAYPEIDTPMYKPLIDISADLFLPNINFVSQNSISLLETNQMFIEAYMVGLNHEMARELIWREYPADQRGSYFRQFWDVSDFIYENEDIEKLKNIAKSKLPADATEEEINEKLQEEIRKSLKDIPKIHIWKKDSNLGDHDHREDYKQAKLAESSTGGGSDEEDKNEVVLVIRGELLKKYPTAVIYAHKAEWQKTNGEIDNSKERILTPLSHAEADDPPRTKVKTPLYEAKAEPDIYFFGFDLDVLTAKGGSGEPGDTEPGWFFVIQERPGEPRFGLDINREGDINVWNDLTWGDVVPGLNDGDFISLEENINLTDPHCDEDDPLYDSGLTEKCDQYKEDKQLTWNNDMNAAEIAYILYQAPVMVAFHAAEMLPKL